ncbi:MAG: choice-of-anchor J domain-containing protein [Bacteroidales bacterium]|nr:choice-of-anchor J domain-containing protein [Bacteroidales bacterium]
MRQKATFLSSLFAIVLGLLFWCGSVIPLHAQQSNSSNERIRISASEMGQQTESNRLTPEQKLLTQDYSVFDRARKGHPMPSPYYVTQEEVIRYDNGINDDAIGLTNGGTFEVAAYWPASSMGQYAGMKLEAVEVYINDVPNPGKIKIYGQGSASAPGPLLYDQVFASTPDSWIMVELDDAVDITGDDIWIGYEVTHTGGTYPAGCDAGPAVAGFGDMIALGGDWDPISSMGFDINWNIAGYLVSGVTYAIDVGAQSLVSPVSAPELGNETVTVRVKNYGTSPQSNISVSYSVDGGSAVTGTIPGPLAAGATVDFTFPGTVNLGVVGQTYAFEICATVSGDQNPANNCRTVDVTNVMPVYCDASTGSQDEYIARVQIAAIDNSSGWQGGVADYTDQIAIVPAGAGEEIIVTNGNPWASDKVTVWVDWNGDYEFGVGTDEEFVLLSNDGGAYFTGEIIPPAGTPEGLYRMRIRMSYSVDPVPCGNMSYGEVEDYSVLIPGGTVVVYPKPRNFTATPDGLAALLEWDAPILNNNMPDGFGADHSATYATLKDQPLTEVAESAREGEVAFTGGETKSIANRAVLYDNGPFINGPGQGAGGADISYLHSGMTGYGANINQAAGYRLTDDFEVTGDWNIESFTFYTYQTGSPTTSTITGAFVQIWNGKPDEGGQVIYGDMVSNLMISTEWTGAYRVSGTALTNTDRPIMAVVAATPGLSLQPGTYWVDFSLTGSIASGPWGIPITITGETTTGNGLQFTGTAWQDWLDGGTSTQLGLPFVIDGSADGGGVVNGPLVGYNIYRDGQQVATVGPEAVSYFDSPLEGGVYQYQLTAEYGDPYPGESDPVSASAIIVAPSPIPFVEDFSGGFEVNGWMFDSSPTNWTINNNTGNPAPSAQFGWSPTQTDYSMAMISKNIIATEAEENVTLKFDLNLSDYAGNGNEKMSAYIWDGSDWVLVTTIVNNESIPWTTFSFDVTAQALGKVTKIKFVASGLTTFDINYWYIDNVMLFEGVAGDAPVIEVSPMQLTETLETNQTSVQQITVTNTGGGALNFDLEVNTTRQNTSAGNTPEDYERLADRLNAEGREYVMLSRADRNQAVPSPYNITQDEIIRYDNGINDDAIGLTSGGTFEVSAYWPASSIGQYAGMKLEAVEVYINDVPNPGKIKIYGPGSSSAPGQLLYEQVFASTPDSWIVVELDDAVDITGDDIWIGYEVTHTGGTYPAGCDAGPAVAGFGDMIALSGDWDPISSMGFDINWNIAGYLVQGIVYANDIGVQSLVSPVSAPELTEEEVVTIRVKNYGTNPQSNISVSYTLDGGTAVTGTIPGPLAPDATIDFTFDGTVDLSTVGQTYVFEACATVTGDENPNNDCRTFNVTNIMPVYCDASTTYEDEYIARVQIGSIDNSSGWQGGVADYTHLSTSIPIGGSEEIIITNGNPWASDKVTVWVDWNGDYEFGVGTNEQFVLTSVASGASFVGQITVPPGTAEGFYRMRIRMSYSTDPTPCGVMSYGEVEDYTIQVGWGTPWISATPLSGIVNPGQSVTINVTFNSSETIPGTYHGSLVFTSNDLMNPEVTVPATLNVTANERPMPRNLVGTNLGDGALLEWQAPDLGGSPGGEDFYEDFEAGTLPTGWVVYDVDGDGYNWENTAINFSVFDAHSGLYCMTSASYVNNVGALNPNNWLVTPPIAVTANSELKFWVDGQDPAYSDEQYYVRISTTGNAVADFTQTIHSALATPEWSEVVLGLGAYAGQTIYIAFVHTDVTDEFYIKIDDVTVTNTASRSAYTTPVAYTSSTELSYREGGSPAEVIAVGSTEPLDIAVSGGTPVEVVTGIKHMSGTSSRSLLFDNGPFVNAPGQGAGGADVSHLHSGLNTYGPNANNAGGYRIADDFVVDETWEIESFTFYSYQTGSTTTSTYTGGFIQIWDAAPDAGGQVIWGDLTTNLMTSTAWTNAYRTNETALTNTDRPIMQIVCATPGLELDPGTYWVDFSLTGSIASGPWAVPVTITGQITTGNAKQNTGTAWVDLEDSGTNTPYGISFIIEGDAGSSGSYNLLGYNVYRDGEQIGNTASNVRTFIDSPLDEGTYVFGVTAVYGEPTAGESDMLTTTLKVYPPASIPFFEDWASGSFEENEWYFDPSQGNWSVTTGTGNPAPAAQFGWSPTTTNYSQSLISTDIDASSAEENVTLEFDIFLNDYNSNGNEKINVHIWNGSEWVLLESIANFGDIPWTTKSYDVTPHALGKTTKIRFEATGLTTFDFNYWYIDNIKLYEGEPVFYPAITVSPASLEFNVFLGGSQNLDLTVGNTGEGALIWTSNVQYVSKQAVEPVVVPPGPKPTGNILELSHKLGEPGGSPAPQDTRETVILHYDGENDGNAIGLTNGGTFHVAARFPSAMVSDYAGYTLESVDIYINDTPTSATLKIWGAGTASAPGPVLHQQGFSGAFAWETVTLTSPVTLTGEDIWVGYTVEHVADDFPAGCDAGPANPNGDWISTDGNSWDHLAGFDLNYNWNIRALINEGVSYNWLSLNPTTGTVAAGGSQTVTVTANSAEDDLPVGTFNANIKIASNDPVAPVKTVPVQLNVMQGTGEEAMALISIYPVPANKELIIDLVEGVKSIRLFNYMGQVVSETAVTGELKLHMNVENLKPGAYTLQFINAQGELYNKTVLINR